MTPKQKQFLNEAQNHYLQGIYDEDEIIEDLKIVNFIKRFFNKLHENKLINVQLLVNHEIIIYNVFEHAWIPGSNQDGKTRTSHIFENNFTLS